MTERMSRRECWSYIERVLANTVVAEKGKLACVDTTTGELTKGAVSTTLRPIGTFEENLTGDGTTTVRVRLFREVFLTLWDNSGTDAVTDAHFGQLCYVEDDTTVSQTDGTSTQSAAGRVWAVTSAGVLVENGAP